MSDSQIPKLGALEMAVLEHLWSNDRVTAKEVHESLGAARGISVNTVQSTLERLYRKQLLSREKCGRSFRYAAARSREQLVALFVDGLLGRFGADATSAFAAFIETSDEIDAEELIRLESILRRRREELGP